MISKGATKMKSSAKQNAICILLMVLMLFVTSCAHKVRIQSIPTGARVTDTARGYLGTTSDRPILIKDIPTGSHLDLYFDKPDYEPKVIALHNIRADQNILVELAYAPTVLWVGSIPAGAHVAFRDERGQSITFRNLSDLNNIGDFSNQRYAIPNNIRNLTLVLEKPGYHRIERKIGVTPGRENRQSYILTPRSATITIRTVPEGAEVYERRLNLLGTTPIENLKLSYEHLKRLHHNPQSEELRSVNLLLTIRKASYVTVEHIMPASLYDENPALTIELRPTSTTETTP
jgi:hypothetical protein